MGVQGLFSSIPLWAVLLGTFVLALLVVEIGFRWARNNQKRYEQDQETEKEAPVGAMVGAALGLLAFLLTFTFGMAADGFHGRRVALLEEANAIRTTYLRADLISEPHRTEVRRILRDYVEQRLQWAGVDRGRPVRSSQQLLDQLWAQAAAEGQRNPGLAVVGLFIESANEVIALNAERELLRERGRIPDAFWLMLYLVAALALAAMGYHGGVAGTTRSPVMVAVAVSFSLVIMLIADLNRPGEGWINVSQDAMVDVRDALARPAR